MMKKRRKMSVTKSSADESAKEENEWLNDA